MKGLLLVLMAAGSWGVMNEGTFAAESASHRVRIRIVPRHGPPFSRVVPHDNGMLFVMRSDKGAGPETRKMTVSLGRKPEHKQIRQQGIADYSLPVAGVAARPLTCTLTDR